MERLQKVMAHAGIASRRKCEEIIQAGRVKVNGETIRELGTKVSNNDLIEVDNVPIYREEPRYFLLYKPKSTISAVSDDKDRPVVVDLIEEVEERIYPIGRLDFDTTGLLLLTNDGDFANILMHPSYQVPKTYIAKVSDIPTEKGINLLRRGIVIDGKKTAPAQVNVKSVNKENRTSIVELTIREGWNHQVKKMFEAINCPVSKLKRERIGFLDLGKLQPGEYRELTAFELDKLKKFATNK